MSISNWQKESIHSHQVGDRVELEESPWLSSSFGKVIQVTEQTKPKATTYTVQLEDGQIVRGVKDADLNRRVGSTDHAFETGDQVATPVGPGYVVQIADTPLGTLYRVRCDFSGSTSDFLEHEIHETRIKSFARSMQ